MGGANVGIARQLVGQQAASVCFKSPKSFSVQRAAIFPKAFPSNAVKLKAWRSTVKHLVSVRSCKPQRQLYSVSKTCRRRTTQCSAADGRAIDLITTDGSSEDYPILLEEATAPNNEWAKKKEKLRNLKKLEGTIERTIFDTRFFALMGVAGSLIGAFLCFAKGCVHVHQSILVAWRQGVGSYKVVLKLIEALDTYLVATVMLIFGMGLYELFVNELETLSPCDSTVGCKSNLFGLFRLRERPKWLQINRLDELKEKLGHVIVMILLVGMFEKSKKVPVRNGIDLLCVAASVLLCAGSLYLLNQLSKSSK